MQFGKQEWEAIKFLARAAFIIAMFISVPVAAWAVASYVAGGVFHEGLAGMTLADIGQAILSILVFIAVLVGGFYGAAHSFDE